MPAKKRSAPKPAPASLGLPLVGVETHAHLDMEPLKDELDGVLDRAREAGVSRVGQVFLGPDAYEAGRHAFAERREVFFTLGVHPHEATAANDDALARMDRAFQDDPRLKALGEIGLDFYRDWSPFPAQRTAFRHQLALARERDLPVVIHSRDAHDETIATLDDMGFADRPVLWHCFSGGPELVDAVARRGWSVSIPGVVTFAKNEALRRAVAVAPLERLMLETDCPFLTPAPYRGKTNEPAYLVFTASEVASIRNVTPEAIWRAAAQNATSFFALDNGANEPDISR